MYDIFVSYATPDAEWASRVEQSLIGRGLNIFFDRTRLELGKAWVPELRRALTESKNFVVLWTDHANQSPWVQRELATFDALVNDDPTRRLLVLNLQGSNRAYASLQAINDLLNANVYDTGMKAVDPALWERVMTSIERAIDADAGAVPVPLAVLTLRDQDFRRIEPAAVERMAQGLGITTEELSQRYGPTRLDWKPIGSARTIHQMLDDLREQLNSIGASSRFRWDLEPERFWDADVTEETKQFARQFAAAKLSVLIIDAVALHDEQVYRRLMLFQPCLMNQRSAIFVLPFANDPRLQAVRKWLKDRGHPYFEPYYDPLRRPDVRVLAQCGFGIGDEEDMKRLLLVNMGQFFGGAAEHKPEYLTVGAAAR
jgi:TIR domain-containing protein